MKLDEAREWLNKGIAESPDSLELKKALEDYYRTYDTPKPKGKN